MATQYRLELDHVHCDKLQDVVGPDELKIIVDGTVQFGGNAGGKIGKGERVELTGRSQLFTDHASVHLVEVDAGDDNDDDLGTTTVDGATDLNRGVIHREFTLPRSEYRLAYKVVAA